LKTKNSLQVIDSEEVNKSSPADEASEAGRDGFG
jgi:hypothetical protein